MFSFSMDRDPDTQAQQIVLSGEIDLFAAPDFKSRLYEAVGEGNADIILDCAGLSYIDSTGLGILLGALKRVRQNNRQVYVRNLKDSIRKLFRITGLDRAFNLEDAQ